MTRPRSSRAGCGCGSRTAITTRTSRARRCRIRSLCRPNVTGSLHIGHALGSTMQDILIRWKRMQGFNAMWMPGIDHASIAVHVLLEKDLKRREGKTRFDLGRDEFLRRAWAWKERSGSRITEQEKLMGFSLDWTRERFTMD